MIPLSNKIARKPQPITKKERLKGAALWGVQALVVPSSSSFFYKSTSAICTRLEDAVAARRKTWCVLYGRVPR